MTPAESAQALPMLSPSNILAVASGKGGVGKTWLSVTLAHAMGLRRRQVLLFDADMGLANIDVQLGLLPELDVARSVLGGIPMADVVCKAAGGKFDVIAGKSGSGTLGRLTPAQLGNVTASLLELACDYDSLILDLGAGVDDLVMQMAGTAGRCLVVVTDEPTSLTDGYAFIKVARARHPQMTFDIVVNMADTIKDGERTYGAMRRACESFLQFSPALLGIIRRDPRVRESIRRQTPTLTCHPTAIACADVEAIAATLIDRSAQPYG